MITAPALKRLLLDFGGPVLLTPFELAGKAEQTLGPMPWRGPFDHGSDHEYVRWQRGDITERDYWTVRADAYGLDIHGLMRHFYEPAGDYLVRPEMVELISRHRAAGRAVGVLTNDMDAFHGPRWKEGISVIKQFDFIVDGSLTGYLKPDPRAFRLALKAFGDPDPSCVVFVDDQRSNLRGRRGSGHVDGLFRPDRPSRLDRTDRSGVDVIRRQWPRYFPDDGCALSYGGGPAPGVYGPRHECLRQLLPQ